MNFYCHNKSHLSDNTIHRTMRSFPWFACFIQDNLMCIYLCLFTQNASMIVCAHTNRCSFWLLMAIANFIRCVFFLMPMHLLAFYRLRANAFNAYRKPKQKQMYCIAAVSLNGTFFHSVPCFFMFIGIEKLNAFSNE